MKAGSTVGRALLSAWLLSACGKAAINLQPESLESGHGATAGQPPIGWS